MKKITILGAGMVGRAIAYDLSSNFDVTSVDFSHENLNKVEKLAKIKTEVADLSKKTEIERVISNADLVIGALPGFMGFESVKTVINAGKNIVDISFFPEDFELLKSDAEKASVTAIVDCGVAPGLSNIWIAHNVKTRKVTLFECMVGGLPEERTLPFQYKAPFSPIDVIEEYTRPARFVENSMEVVKEALSGSEFINFPGVGTLEAFFSDGLRSLLKTVKVPTMYEKTLRYPGHAGLMRAFASAGFFSTVKKNINGVEIVPLDFTSQMLIPLWKLEEEDREFTAMRFRILVENNDGSQSEEFYYLFDKYDTKTGISSMARTTGFTCTAAARAVLNGTFTSKGIFPPEFLGFDDKTYKFILEELMQRGIYIKK